MKYTVKDISVIITCYNEGELLRRAFDSVSNLTLQGFQTILVNDCSPDPVTDQVCEDIANGYDVRYIRLETNGGSAVARNAALQTCCTELIVPLDGDDELPKDLLSFVLSAFNNNPGADFLFGDYLISVPETGKTTIVDSSIIANEQGFLEGEKLARNWILLGQSPYKRKLWEQVGGFKVEFSRTFEDLIFWRDAIMKDLKGYRIPETIYVWHRSEKGKNASQDEDTFLNVRIYSMPFYDRYFPEYADRMRTYIYRYFSSRLLPAELSRFVRSHPTHFSSFQKLKVKLMHVKPLYKALRILNNKIRAILSVLLFATYLLH